MGCGCNKNESTPENVGKEVIAMEMGPMQQANGQLQAQQVNTPTCGRTIPISITRAINPCFTVPTSCTAEAVVSCCDLLCDRRTISDTAKIPNPCGGSDLMCPVDLGALLVSGAVQVHFTVDASTLCQGEATTLCFDTDPIPVEQFVCITCPGTLPTCEGYDPNTATLTNIMCSTSDSMITLTADLNLPEPTNVDCVAP